MITIFQPYESDHVYDNNVAHLPMRLDDNLAQVVMVEVTHDILEW